MTTGVETMPRGIPNKPRDPLPANPEPRKVSAYRIPNAPRLDQLEEKVAVLLGTGYIPLGSVTQLANGTYAQTMYKG